MVDISIIIVHYKTMVLLKECLASIEKNTEPKGVEVIVIDNESEDGAEAEIRALFPNTNWINMGYNAGFARANNVGIKKANGKFLLLLNPDTTIPEGFLKKMMDEYSHTDNAGLLSCRIISSIDGSLLIGTGRGFPSIVKHIKANPIYIFITRSLGHSVKKYNANTFHYTSHEVDFLSGACVMIEREKVLKHNLLLDEDFFLYSEDMEWSYRVKQCGYKNWFTSNAEVYHVNSASTGNSFNKRAQVQISEYLFYFKTNSLVMYYIIGWIIKCNFALDLFLLKRKGNLLTIDVLKRESTVFDDYFFEIPKNYKRKNSQGTKYLKYASKN